MQAGRSRQSQSIQAGSTPRPPNYSPGAAFRTTSVLGTSAGDLPQVTGCSRLSFADRIRHRGPPAAKRFRGSFRKVDRGLMLGLGIELRSQEHDDA